MKKLLLGFIVLLLAIGLGFLVQKDPGYVLMTYNGWSLETSVWIAITAMVILFLVFHFVLRILQHTSLLGDRFQRWGRMRRRRKSREHAHSGFRELAEGNWSCAERLLVKSTKGINASLINYMAAARAAQAQKAFERRDQYLRRAHDAADGSEMAIGLTLAEMQINSQQWEQALATLERLKQQAPKHPRLLFLLQQVTLELNDWTSLEALLPQLTKRKILPTAELYTLALRVYAALLHKNAHNASDLNQTWSDIPKTFRADPTLLHIYISALLARGQKDEAATLIEKSLKQQWDSNLLMHYADAANNNTTQQLRTAEGWLKTHPKDPALLRCVGRLSLHEKFLGKARDYLEESLDIMPSAETHQILAAVFVELGDTQAALEHYQNANR